MNDHKNIKGARTAPVVARRDLGSFFELVTKKPVREFATVDDIDSAVAKALHVGKLEFAAASYRLGIRNGDVFKHVRASPKGEIDRRIDKVLAGA